MNYSRQLDIYDAENRKDVAYIIGAGATGSWLSLILSKLGFSAIKVFDFDIIEEHNLPNQFFKNRQVGMLKVRALGKNIAELGSNPSFEYASYATKITKDVEEDTEYVSTYSVNALTNRMYEDMFDGYTVSIFCLVDSMTTRKEIFEALVEYLVIPNKDRDGNELTAYPRFIETRMGLTGYRIYDIDLGNLKDREEYRKTLYSDEEAEASACGTSKSIVSTAIQCASHAVGMLLGNLNGIDYIPNEVIFDIQSSVLLTKKFDKGE